MGYLERNFVVKWIEWNPVPFTLKSKESLPSKYSFGLTQLSLTLLLPMGVLGYLSHDWPVAWQLLPLYLSLFIFGMPHGGADHLLIWGMIKNSSFGFRIGTLLAYPILSMIYLAVWNLQPLPSALFFLGLTVFHWGQGGPLPQCQTAPSNLPRTIRLTQVVACFFTWKHPDSSSWILRQRDLPRICRSHRPPRRTSSTRTGVDITKPPLFSVCPPRFYCTSVIALAT